MNLFTVLIKDKLDRQFTIRKEETNRMTFSKETIRCKLVIGHMQFEYLDPYSTSGNDPVKDLKRQRPETLDLCLKFWEVMSEQMINIVV